VKRLTPVFLLLLGILCVAVLAADDKNKLSAAEVISKHLAAVGGPEAMAKIKSRVAIGTARKDGDAAAPIAVMSEAPNRVSAICQFQDFNWQLTYDGRKSIVRPILAGANVPVMHKYEDMLATGTLFNDISLYNVLAGAEGDGVRFEAKGTKKVKGRPAYTVEMKKGDHKALLYFDAESYMWVRTDYGSVSMTRDMRAFTNAVESKDQESTYDFYVETSDFKQVDGVKVPFKFEIVATAPILKQKSVGTIVVTISEYRHNIDIDPKMFQ
jgi:hypothetical protein